MIEVLHLRQPSWLTHTVYELALTDRIGRAVDWIGSKFIGGGRGWGATTLPLPYVTVILYNGNFGPIDPLTRVHEFAHVRQRENLKAQGRSWFSFIWRYVREYARVGYDRNSFEQEAHSVQAEAAKNGLPDWAA